MILDLLTDLAKDNKILPFMKGIRIANDRACTSNSVITLRASGLPYQGVDAYVDAESFSGSATLMKKPDISQDDNFVHLKEGKLKGDLVKMDPVMFGIDPFKEPEGELKEPGDFLAAIKRIEPFLKMKDARAFFINDQLYCANGMFIVKTPVSVSFDHHPERTITVSKQFADMVKKLNKEAQSIHVSDNFLSLKFDNCWIESSRCVEETPDLEQFMKPLESIAYESIPDDVLGSLKQMCAMAEPEDMISFSPMGISLFQQGKCSLNIAHPMRAFSIKAPALANILAVAKEFNFEQPFKLCFRTPGQFMGAWTTKVAE